MKRILLFLSFSFVISLFYCQVSVAQPSLGVPFTQNFAKKDYLGGIQNWDIVQDQNGVVYFANNVGLLSFNGQSWHSFAVKNNSFLRSIALSPEGVIYAGGQGEIGFYLPNKKGAWQYQSLLTKVPVDDQDFDDVWDIQVHKSGIYFHTENKIFHLQNEQMSVVRAKKKFKFLGLFQDDVIVQDGDEEIIYLSGEQKGNVFLSISGLPDVKVTAVIQKNPNQTILSTWRYGFFEIVDGLLIPWPIENQSFFKKNQIYTMIKLSDDNLAVGTSLAGFVILSPSGKVISHIQRSTGLLNNTVRSVFEDKDHNIWLGLDNGISAIEYNSPLLRFYPDDNIKSTGYAAILKDSTFYFGTSNGVYTYSKKSIFDPKAFTKIKGSDGQVWNINIVNNRIVVAQHQQAFRIDGLQAVPISPSGGYWLFQKLIKNDSFIVSGTYHGLELFDNSLNFVRKIKGFDESSRFLEQDADGNIWVTHPNKGVFKLRLNDNLDNVTVTKYGEKDGLASDMANHVFKINNELIFPSQKAIFSYDRLSNRFIRNSAYNKIFAKQETIKRLVGTESNDIWYVCPSEVGVLKVDKHSVGADVQLVRLPQTAKMFVDGFEGIFPFENNQAILPAEQGFIYYDDQKKWSNNQRPNLVFTEVALTNHGDSIFFSGNYTDGFYTVQEQPDSSVFEFPFRENGIRFAFSATKFFRPKSIKYRYKLLGLEDNWSEWTSKTEKEYNNLNGRSYTFSVQAIDEFGNESKPISYHFKVKAAWYASTFAYFVYILALIGFLVFSYRSFAKKYDQQKEIVQRSEEIIDQLKHEKLEADILHKNREIISATLHLTHKNEVFKRVKSDIDKLSKTCTDPKTKDNLKSIIKVLTTEEDAEAGWEEFVAHFNKLHTGFFDNLKSKYPLLSPKDLKMCAYLRMNLTSKEIATLSNITIRGVEGARYRLRKKFNLSGTDNLVDFLMKEF